MKARRPGRLALKSLRAATIATRQDIEDALIHAFAIGDLDGADAWLNVLREMEALERHDRLSQGEPAPEPLPKS